MQKFFTRKRSLARKAAAMMSAVMLFTSEAGVFPGSAAVVEDVGDVAVGVAPGVGEGLVVAEDEDPEIFSLQTAQNRAQNKIIQVRD